MDDSECVEFLQWCLPTLRMRWPGFRKVRGQVCKRITRRITELELPDSSAYREYLDNHPDEWNKLESLCRVTISRFYRDRRVFDTLRSSVLPEIADLARVRGDKAVGFWSAGCASGEETYTLNILWKLHVDTTDRHAQELRIIATDSDTRLLERAQNGLYRKSSLGDMPDEMIEAAFEDRQASYQLNPVFKEGIKFLEQDIRARMPEGPFYLVLCRNLVFTYFEESLQRKLLEGITQRLVRGGFLVIGIHEALPRHAETSLRLRYEPCIYQMPINI